ncbi:hypothetical protein ACFLX5_03275 [Chloroflexota bacterium]
MHSTYHYLQDVVLARFVSLSLENDCASIGDQKGNALPRPSDEERQV